jgi:hypothetical protein
VATLSHLELVPDAHPATIQDALHHAVAKGHLVAGPDGENAGIRTAAWGKIEGSPTHANEGQKGGRRMKKQMKCSKMRCVA